MYICEGYSMYISEICGFQVCIYLTFKEINVFSAKELIAKFGKQASVYNVGNGVVKNLKSFLQIDITDFMCSKIHESYFELLNKEGTAGNFKEISEVDTPYIRKGTDLYTYIANILIENKIITKDDFIVDQL
jgi:hypothetical protein